ncbi:hypothetical protein PUN28_011050 [Cardiocondyla obscurior]|uniref:Uncharacterized protein n=1 Tax=Cardiocondyla obscurior TaxID=286306 RepID=A0AAW2FIX5_9HYME
MYPSREFHRWVMSPPMDTTVIVVPLPGVRRINLPRFSQFTHFPSPPAAVSSLYYCSTSRNKGDWICNKKGFSAPLHNEKLKANFLREREIEQKRKEGRRGGKNRKEEKEKTKRSKKTRSITLPKLKRDDIDRHLYKCERIFVDFTLWTRHVKIKMTIPAERDVVFLLKLNYSR